MSNQKTSNAVGATLLGVPFALLNMDRADTKAPAACACDLLRQAAQAHLPVLQFHCRDGMVHQVDVLGSDSVVELVILLEALDGDGGDFHPIAVAHPLPLEAIPNLFDALEADSIAMVHNVEHRTCYAGVNELRIALETGHAAEVIELEPHVYRRREIADTVIAILQRDPERYPELPRIRRAALDFLAAIDRKIAEAA